MNNIAEDMKVIFGKKRLNYRELAADPDFKRLKEPVVALGAGLSEDESAFAFTDWKELVKFTRRFEFGNTVAEMDERRRTFPKRSGGDMASIKLRRKLVAKRIDADLRTLSKQTELRWGSKALFLRATSKADPLEGEIFDPAMLWTGAGFTGSSVAAVYPGIPNLTWFPGMNNNITSVQVSGVVGLFAATWFGGASRVLFGFPFFQLANLAVTGFNNVTSSVLID